MHILCELFLNGIFILFVVLTFNLSRVIGIQFENLGPASIVTSDVSTVALFTALNLRPFLDFTFDVMVAWALQA